jgi:hypothetical protein
MPPHRKNVLLLRNVSKRLGPGLIPWHDLSNGNRDLRETGFGWLRIGSNGGLL